MWICHSEFQVTTWISRIELNCSRFHQTAANFRDARLRMISGMWRDHEIVNNFNASLSAQQDRFQMDSFLFCRQMEVYNSSLWLWLPFPCFLAIKFWANKMEICTMGNLLTPGCICLLSRHYNLPAWWIFPLWMEWELQVLGVWLKLCASCQWESENIHLQGSTIACFKEDESHSSGAFHHTRGRNTHNMSHLSLVCMFPHITEILNLSDPGCCFKKPLLTRSWFGHSPNSQGGVGS